MLDEFPLVPVSAVNPINDAIVFSSPLASISNVELETDTSMAPNAVVQSNSLRLQQVLINLVSNAIKYTDSGNKITISICESSLFDVHARMDSAVASSRDLDTRKTSIKHSSLDGPNLAVLVFNICDCGPGVAPDQAHRIFRRFGQLDHKPGRTLGPNKIGQPSGTGLGLHLCQLFVQRMNGHIWVSNNEGEKKGCTFSFFLPLLSNSLFSDGVVGIPSSGSRRGSVTSIPSLSVDTGGENCDIYQSWVLLVDDTMINRKVLSRMLKKIGFSNVTTVDSGENALIELTKKKRYDFVISDLQMPGMTGTELCQAIMASSTSEFESPVVVGLTADTSGDVEQRCQASGMSDVLYKPITLKEMKDFVENDLPMMEPGIWYG